jgi:hypothetical protein
MSLNLAEDELAIGVYAKNTLATVQILVKRA